MALSSARRQILIVLEQAHLQTKHRRRNTKRLVNVVPQSKSVYRADWFILSCLSVQHASTYIYIII